MRGIGTDLSHDLSFQRFARPAWKIGDGGINPYVERMPSEVRRMIEAIAIEIDGCSVLPTLEWTHCLLLPNVISTGARIKIEGFHRQ